MEKDVALGQVGELDLSLAAGKAKLELKLALPQAAMSVGAVVEMDAGVLIDKIKAALEAKASPGVAAVEEGVFNVLKLAVQSV